MAELEDYFDGLKTYITTEFFYFAKKNIHTYRPTGEVVEELNEPCGIFISESALALSI